MLFHILINNTFITVIIIIVVAIIFIMEQKEEQKSPVRRKLNEKERLTDRQTDRPTPVIKETISRFRRFGLLYLCFFLNRK